MSIHRSLRAVIAVHSLVPHPGLEALRGAPSALLLLGGKSDEADPEEEGEQCRPDEYGFDDVARGWRRFPRKIIRLLAAFMPRRYAERLARL